MSIIQGAWAVAPHQMTITADHFRYRGLPVDMCQSGLD
jgi:hypothetical protein